MAGIYLYLQILLIVIFGRAVLGEDWTEDEPLPDYYAVLELTPDASVQDIRRSFRRMGLKYHPDKNKDPVAEDIFKKLSEAYAVLNDAEQKRDYDQVLREEMEAARQASEAMSKPDSHRAREKPPVNRPTKPAHRHEQQEEPATIDREEPARREEPAPAQQQNVPESDEYREPTKAASVFDDLDEEALLRLLEILASNEFVITKKVYTNNRIHEEPFTNAYHRTRSSSTPEFSDRFTWSDEPTWSADPWSSSFDCRTTVHWEGQVKVTSTFC